EEPPLDAERTGRESATREAGIEVGLINLHMTPFRAPQPSPIRFYDLYPSCLTMMSLSLLYMVSYRSRSTWTNIPTPSTINS
ncbi:hypothetical protein NFI96_007139, partial [Prochilodus magdalenae]